MGHSFIDKCNRLDSPIHRLDARIKTVGTFMFVLLLVSIPPQHLLSFIVFTGTLTWIVAFSHVPIGGLLMRAAIALPFSAGVALGIPFMPDGHTLDLFGLALPTKGLWMLWGVTVKSLIGTAAFVLLAATTPFEKILGSLRSIGLPPFFVDLLALTYRYVFVIVDEAVCLKKAAIARGYKPRWLPQAALIGRLIGTLFLRSYERAERLYGAMRLRGYDGRLPSGPPPSFRRAEIAGLAGYLSFLVCVRVFAP